MMRAECPAKRPQPPPRIIPHSKLNILRPPASVLLLSADDDLADTIRPRLDALGADCSRVVALPLTKVHQPRGAEPGLRLHETETYDLRRDLDRLDRVLRRRPECRLVIIDPLAAYLGGSDNLNAHVRQLLAKLSDVAARRRVAVLATAHLRKQPGADLHRTLGSLAFIAAARTAWLIVRDPSNMERRLVRPIKNNLAAHRAPLAFTIESADEQPIVCWADPLPLEAENPLGQPAPANGRPSDERDDAVRWLRQTLDAGAKPASYIREAAEANGLRLVTVRRAFRTLGGEAVRIGFGPFGEWFWRLPGIGDQNPSPTLDHLWMDPGDLAPPPAPTI